MVSKRIFEQIGGFDLNYELAYGDVDICLKAMKANYLNVWTPYAKLYHYESKTRGYEDTKEKKERFHKETVYFRTKWSQFLQKGDPFYNGNLKFKFG